MFRQALRELGYIEGQITSLAPPSFVVTSLSADPATFPPLATGFGFSSAFEFPMSELFAYTFTGGEPPGTYRAFLAVVAPGGFADGRIDAGDMLLLVTQNLDFAP